MDVFFHICQWILFQLIWKNSVYTLFSLYGQALKRNKNANIQCFSNITFCFWILSYFDKIFNNCEKIFKIKAYQHFFRLSYEEVELRSWSWHHYTYIHLSRIRSVENVIAISKINSKMPIQRSVKLKKESCLKKCDFVLTFQISNVLLL